MKKLHVLSVKTANDSWEINLSTFKTKEILERKQELLTQGFAKNQIKVQHYVEQIHRIHYAYKATCKFRVYKNNCKLNCIKLAPNFKRMLDTNLNIEFDTHSKYNIDDKELILYFYAFDDNHALTVIDDIISKNYSLINSKMIKCNIS